MLEWRIPELKDYNILKAAADTSGSYGNDCNAVNLILYSRKYNTRICEKNGFLLKRYTETDGTVFYTFPLRTDGNIQAEENAVESAVKELFDDCAGIQSRFYFSMLTEQQKKIAEKIFPAQFTFEETPEAEDYIYLCRNMAELPGKKFHKKKNHINQFKKKYPDHSFALITKENCHDILSIENLWFENNSGKDDYDKEYEKSVLEEIAGNFESYKITGGILYVKDEPCAFCIASETSPGLIDIHFEKAAAPFDRNGAYAVINNKFSGKAAVSGYEYINREEDMGIEGLRKAKLSYYPEIILKKWKASRIT